jgi:DnaK suppressor protein
VGAVPDEMSMNELTQAQIDELKAALAGRRDELKRLLETTREGTRPVDLDEPIGRLTRMDAMQQQNMSVAARRSYDIRLRQIDQALGAIEQQRYGLCRRCEDPIGYARLTARPESPYCLECQDEIDRKHA